MGEGGGNGADTAAGGRQGGRGANLWSAALLRSPAVRTQQRTVAEFSRLIWPTSVCFTRFFFVCFCYEQRMLTGLDDGAMDSVI